MNDLGGLTEEELEDLAESQRAQVTKEAKHLEHYKFTGKMTDICMSVMGAAALRADPRLCTIKPGDGTRLPPGSHIPLPLCSKEAEKIPHVLREKPMPCSLRELDVGVANVRFNHSLLIRHRGAERLFQCKTVNFHESYYSTVPSNDETTTFYDHFQQMYPKGATSLDDVFQVPICCSENDAVIVSGILSDMLFMNLSQRVGGNIQFLAGFPDFKKQIAGKVDKLETTFTLPIRSEAEAYSHYCQAWCHHNQDVKPSAFVSDQHTSQIPKSRRSGEMAVDNLAEFLIGVAESNMQRGQDMHGMALVEKYIFSVLKLSIGGEATARIPLDRLNLVRLIAGGLHHYCSDFSEDNANFLACQVVADLESSIPGIAGDITAESIFPAWGGKFGIDRFGLPRGTFQKKLSELHSHTLQERIRLASLSPVELALQGYAKLQSDNDVIIVNLRTFAPYSVKDTEHEACKAGIGTAQSHTTRTVAKKRGQARLCTHPVPGTQQQRLFLSNDLRVFALLRTALSLVPASNIIGRYPVQMHYFRPCWYHASDETAIPFQESWYTWADEATAYTQEEKKRSAINTDKSNSKRTKR